MKIKYALFTLIFALLSFSSCGSNRERVTIDFIGTHCSVSGQYQFKKEILIGDTFTFKVTVDEGYQNLYSDDFVVIKDGGITYDYNFDSFTNEFSILCDSSMTISVCPDKINEMEEIVVTGNGEVFLENSDLDIQKIDWGDGVIDSHFYEHKYAEGTYVIKIYGYSIDSVGISAKTTMTIKSLKICHQIENINDNDFASVPIDSITVQEGVKTLGVGSFKEMRANKFLIPSTVIQIGYECFKGAEHVDFIFAKNSEIKEIGWTMFLCKEYSIDFLAGSKLDKMSFVSTTTPDPDTHLLWAKVPKNCSEASFEDGFGLQISKVFVEEGNKTYDSRDNSYALIKTATDEILFASESTTFIPNSIKIVGGFNHSNIENVFIPENVIEIKDGAFSECKKLKTIKFAEDSSLKKIGTHAFMQCPLLKELINFPVHMESIGYSAFSECSSLESIIIPDGIKTIEYSTFWRCNNLKNVVLPNSLESIESSAFNSANNINYTSYNNGDYLGNDSNGHLALIKTSSKEVESFEFSSSVKIIAGDAFSHCEKLKQIELPNCIPTIEAHTFEYCKELETISFKEKLTSIKEGAFLGCESLTSIKIPNNITYLGYYCFRDCTKLTDIDLTEVDHVIENEAGMFHNCNLKSGSIKVKQELYWDYIKAPGWNDYASYITGV